MKRFQRDLSNAGRLSMKQCFAPFHLRINFRGMDVRYERGVYLPDHDLWLDPWDAKRFAFVSHAHSDHIAPHAEIILSEAPPA